MSDSRTQPYFFAFDTKSKPGKMIGHFVRFETLEMDVKPGAAGLDASFKLLGADVENDKRIRQMIGCAHAFKEENPQCFPKEE